MTPPFMGVGEIALRLGVSPQRAQTISRRKSFPAAARITAGRVWATEDVETWISEHWDPPTASTRVSL